MPGIDSMLAGIMGDSPSPSAGEISAATGALSALSPAGAGAAAIGAALASTPSSQASMQSETRVSNDLGGFAFKGQNAGSGNSWVELAKLGLLALAGLAALYLLKKRKG